MVQFIVDDFHGLDIIQRAVFLLVVRDRLLILDGFQGLLLDSHCLFSIGLKVQEGA